MSLLGLEVAVNLRLGTHGEARLFTVVVVTKIMAIAGRD